jgi:hypothetical protein
MITVDNHFLKCSAADKLGINTRDDLAHRVMGQAHRWRVAYRSAMLGYTIPPNGWLIFSYYPSDESQVSFVFYGRGFWFDVLRGAWEVEREKLRTIGVACVEDK